MSSTFHKPSVDKREYRHMQLGPPHAALDVLLISDPNTDKASAAMDVHVGQLCDPLPGLAHFLEHMLFIGTKKYPSENAYDQFVTTHGGSTNAFTALEHTCYFFDVQAGDLEGALDRFAQCFVGPLFTQTALEREVQAVDSEHHKNLQQDLWRLDQLSKGVLAPGHAYASFGSGNQETLPIATVREALIEFYEQHYLKSLALYKLVVLGKESLDELDLLVHRYFDEFAQALESHSQPRDELLPQLFPPITNWQVPQRLHVIPVSPSHSLELQFPISSQLAHWQSKPTRYISHLLGHEGQGSLLSLLKQKNYALYLYADDASKSCIPWNIFTIKMELTDLGLQNVEEVVQIIFSYVELLKSRGPQPWIQEELQTVGDLQFRFLSQQNPMDYTCSVVGAMHLYPPSHYLSGPYTVSQWDPQTVTECLEALNPDNVLWLVSSPTFVLKNAQTEPWYKTQYEQIELEEALQNQLRTALSSDFPELQLPQVNDLIATDFELLSEEFQASVPKDAPQCISLLSTANGTSTGAAITSSPSWPHPLLQLWYKPDNVFQMPKVNLSFHFESSIATATPEAAVATRLYVEWIQEQVNEFTYLASTAGLHAGIGQSTLDGLDLQVSGYHHKAHLLVEKLLHVVLTSLDENVPENVELFERLIYKVEQEFQNFMVATPYEHAMDGAEQILEAVTFSIPQKLAALRRLARSSKSPQQLIVEHARRFWRDCRVVALVHGNVTPGHAKELTQSIWKALNEFRGKAPVDDANGNNDSSSDELALALAPPVELRVVHLKPGVSYVYRFEEYNPEDTNSCTYLLLQMGPLELEDNAKLAFLHHLIKEPFFNQLRTEEQLGYIVHTSIKTSGYDIKSLLFLIQSDGFDPIHVDQRIEEFLVRFRLRIQNMSKEDFETNVNSVVASFLEKNKNLGEESMRYWRVMMRRNYDFLRLQKLADVTKTLSKEKVLQFFDKYVAASAPSRRKLCVQVFAKQHAEKMEEPVANNVVVLKDPNAFKRAMALYGLPKEVELAVVEL